MAFVCLGGRSKNSRVAGGSSSPQSSHQRSMVAKRALTDKERAFFLHVDFTNHVALVAEVKDRDRTSIVAGGRYVADQPGAAEIAFAVIDDYQGQGIGAALLRHLAILARSAGLKVLTAEVLAENVGMLKVFDGSGLCLSKTRDVDVVHVSLRLS